MKNNYVFLLQRIKESLERHCIGDGCFSDVTFELDDGLMKVD